MKLVSIILPTFNRAKFLPNSLEAIKKQTYENWELIVVDDGSTDDTQQVLECSLLSFKNETKVISQTNKGPANARNSGIKAAKGDFIAFYDSDDLWIDEHLEKCLSIMYGNDSVDWLYTACKRIDLLSKKVYEDNSFYNGKCKKPLFTLKTLIKKNLYIIEDTSAAELSITHGIESCFQASVIKSKVFEKIMIPDFRVGEDRMFVTLALKKGFKLAFWDHVNVLYNVHDENISDTNPSNDLDKRIKANKLLIDSYKQTFRVIDNLTISEKRALRRKIANETFWILGYNLYWLNNRHHEALKTYVKGLSLQPANLNFWKTTLSSLFKLIVSKR